MSKYQRPKQQVHHEFLYLNHDSILNALSALEAGAVDEIILKTNEAREGGLDANISAGPVKAGAGKKRQATIQEELVRRRTWFSGFDAWYRALKEHDAIGTFDQWDMEVRDDLRVGDTVEFSADLRLSPVHKVLAGVHVIRFERWNCRLTLPTERKGNSRSEVDREDDGSLDGRSGWSPKPTCLPPSWWR